MERTEGQKTFGNHCASYRKELRVESHEHQIHCDASGWKRYAFGLMTVLF